MRKIETVYSFPEDWEQIAFIDESADYEVDQTAIFKTKSGFALATATGCSCWDGDWEVSKFRKIERLFEAIGGVEETGHEYNPTFAGAKSLREQALASLA